jgi:hypothetical protein
MSCSAEHEKLSKMFKQNSSKEALIVSQTGEQLRALCDFKWFFA